jgi:membrane protein required for colicin V production
MTAAIADAAILLIIAISAFLAYARGLTREALAIGGWIVAALAAFFFAPFVEPLIAEVPWLGDFLRSSCTLSLLAAFAACFAAVLILLSIVTPIISGVILDSALGPFDRGLGFLFGVARGVALVAVLYLLYGLLVPENQRIAALEEAQSIGLISDAAQALQENAPQELPPFIATRIDRLMGACGPAAPETSSAATDG